MSTEAVVNNLFSGRYYGWNRLFMSQIGIWPRQSQLAKRTMRIFFVFICVLGLFLGFVKLYKLWGTGTDNFIECLPYKMIIGIGLAKLFTGVVKQPAILELVERIERDWVSLSKYPSSLVILKKYAEVGRMLTISYAGLLYLATTAFVGLPVLPLVMNVLIPLNESRPRKYLFEAEYGVDTEEYYYYILFEAALATYMVIMIYVIADTTLSAWMQHCCALFEIVSYNLKNATREVDGEISKVHPIHDVEYTNLCFCIKQQKEAMTFANLIESTYSTSQAFVIACNMIFLSISGVMVIIKINDDFEEVLRFVVLTVTPAFHLYFSAVLGQNLIDHSERVGESAYQCEWSDYSLRAQKLLVLIIARAQKPCIITAGKVYLINVENFSAVVRTSVSYFTAICSLRIADE